MIIQLIRNGLPGSIVLHSYCSFYMLPVLMKNNRHPYFLSDSPVDKNPFIDMIFEKIIAVLSLPSSADQHPFSAVIAVGIHIMLQILPSSETYAFRLFHESFLFLLFSC